MANRASEDEATRAVAEGRRLAAMPDEARVKAIAYAATERYVATGDMSAAVGGILEAVRARPAPTDPDTGLPLVSGRS